MARKSLTGKVISDKMAKTRVVAIERVYAHPVYKKVMRRLIKVHAHDEKNVSRPGDYVLMRETRPFSKTKRWEITEVTKPAAAVVTPAQKNTNGAIQ